VTASKRAARPRRVAIVGLDIFFPVSEMLVTAMDIDAVIQVSFRKWVTLMKFDHIGLRVGLDNHEARNIGVVGIVYAQRSSVNDTHQRILLQIVLEICTMISAQLIAQTIGPGSVITKSDVPHQYSTSSLMVPLQSLNISNFFQARAP
jgi:hypothetical protein